MEKEKWIKRARLAFRPSARQNCYVCGKFGAITQAHHTVPLAVQFEYGYKNAAPQHAWLCPNHHTILHLLIDNDHQSFGRRAVQVMDDMPLKQWKIMLELIQLSVPDRPKK